MRPRGAPLIHHAIEAAGVLRPKSQSPSTLQWRLSVEVRADLLLRHNGYVGHASRPNGQSPLPGLVAPLLRLTPMGNRRTRSVKKERKERKQGIEQKAESK
jgi:hypothetical protein